MTLDNVLLSSALHSSKFIFIPLIASTAKRLKSIMRRWTCASLSTYAYIKAQGVNENV